MNKPSAHSRLSMRARLVHSISSSLSIYSDYGKRYSDYSFDDDVDDDDDDEDISSDEDSYEWENRVKKEHNAVSWVLANEAYCFDLNKFAERLIDATFIEAKKTLGHRQNTVNVNVVSSVVDELLNVVSPDFNDSQMIQPNNRWPFTQSSSSEFTMSSNVGVVWPKISEFNIKSGLEKLEDYVSTWERSHDWMFCVEFLGFECEDSSNVFIYEVEWSKPTCEYPIPQATASVYFALEVFKMVPYNYDRSVEVTYIFEASNVIHYPGRIDFQEKWLEDILEAKLKFFKAFNFAVPKGYCDSKKSRQNLD